MLWLNFLHIYQPPTLEKDLLIRISKEAYFNIVRVLLRNPQYKITLNITACLTEYLNQIGYTKLTDDLNFLVARGQIELTGSAAFHPLLPLMPIKEVERQIQINYDINRRYFGKLYQPQGFFLPEMAYADATARAIKRAGFHWIILDEISFDGRINSGYLDYTKKYKLKNIGLNVVFRNRKISKTFVPGEIEKILNQEKRPEIVITATPSSWESTSTELIRRIPYSLWQHPKNKIHKQLWQLANFALQLNYQSRRDPNHFASRLHLEKGLASCTFWWASDKDFKLFDYSAWNPGEVEKGALELLRSVRSLDKINPQKKITAEKMFLAIHKEIWTKHWGKFKKTK